MGSPDPSCYCNICLGDSRQIVRQTVTSAEHGLCKLSQPASLLPLRCLTSATCFGSNPPSHPTHTLPSASIVLFIFLARAPRLPSFFLRPAAQALFRRTECLQLSFCKQDGAAASSSIISSISITRTLSAPSAPRRPASVVFSH